MTSHKDSIQKQTNTMTHITHIAGIPHHNPDLSKLKVGDELRLLPEPSNKFDPNAIRVFARPHSDFPEHLGYIPKMETQFFRDLSSVYITAIQPTVNWKEVLISNEKPEEQ